MEQGRFITTEKRNLLDNKVDMVHIVPLALRQAQHGELFSRDHHVTINGQP